MTERPSPILSKVKNAVKKIDKELSVVVVVSSGFLRGYQRKNGKKEGCKFIKKLGRKDEEEEVVVVVIV